MLLSSSSSSSSVALVAVAAAVESMLSVRSRPPEGRTGRGGMRSCCAVAPSGADLVNELLESDDGMEGGDECAECSSDEVLADTPVGLVGRGGGAGRKPAVVPEAERAGGRVCAAVVDISELERNRMPSAALCSCVCVCVREWI